METPVVCNPSICLCDTVTHLQFHKSFAKKMLKMLISTDLKVSSYKATEMDEKSNFFNAIGQ